MLTTPSVVTRPSRPEVYSVNSSPPPSGSVTMSVTGTFVSASSWSGATGTSNSVIVPSVVMRPTLPTSVNHRL